MEIVRYINYDFISKFLRHDIDFKNLMENTVDVSETIGDSDFYKIIIKLPDDITY